MKPGRIGAAIPSNTPKQTNRRHTYPRRRGENDQTGTIRGRDEPAAGQRPIGQSRFQHDENFSAREWQQTEYGKDRRYVLRLPRRANKRTGANSVENRRT